MFDFLSRYLLATPDFGHSDVWHFNFALKFLLSKTLKAGYFPLWSKDIGTGFPLLGEGQIGMFNLYNLLTFKFLNPILAFNIGYITIFLTIFTGSYLFGRIIKLSRLSAVFLGIIFCFSGVFVTQANHFNLIQAASFLPLEFFLVEKIIQSSQKRWPVILGIVLSQQIFAGFQQSLLISLIGVTIYSFGRVWKNKEFKPLFRIFLSLAGGTIIALPQILPSRQLVELSFRNTGLSVEDLARFPFHPKEFLAFFFPYVWGDPRNGTFPPFSKDWGIFWESTGYFGILPIFLIPIAFLHKKLKQRRKIIVFLILTAFILLLGKYTPFFFIFQIPPLSYFRVPARFILLFVWGLTVLAAIGLERINSKTIKFLILLIATADLLNFAFHYNPIIDSRAFLKIPGSVQFLQKDLTWYRIYTVTPFSKWNQIFLNQGWSDMRPYQQLTNALDPNQNLYWGINSSDFYAGNSSKRLDLWKNILDGGIKSDEVTNSFSVSSEAGRLLNLSGVKYLISPYAQGPSNFGLVATISGHPQYYVWENPGQLAHAYLTQNYTVARNVPDLYQKLVSGKTPVLEKAINLQAADNFYGSVTIIQDQDLEMDLISKSNSDSLLVVADSYYPGWRVYISGQETTIMPVNLNQRAVLVPKGNHQIRFLYDPYSLSKSLPNLLSKIRFFSR